MNGGLLTWTDWHDSGALRSPTRADSRGRLEAIGPGRWASLFPGARVTEREPARPRHLQTVWGVGYRFVP